MNENEILEKLSENIYNWDNVENEISMIRLAIYEKNIEKLKQAKINEAKKFLEQKASFYNQKTEKFNNEINANLEKYQKEIEKLINFYNNLFINVFKIMENSRSNQKIAIANIVTLSQKLRKQSLNNEEMRKYRNTIIACAEKKLNFSVITEECNARLEWCVDDAIKTINEVFQNNIYQLQIYDEKIVSKIKRKIFNIFTGKSSYKKFLNNYKSEYLKNIKEKNDIKIMYIAAIIKGILKQMEDAKEQISLKYQEKISA